MAKIKSIAQKHKKLLITMLIFIVVGTLAFTLLGGAGSAPVAEMPATTTLVKGELTQTVTANGTMQSANSKDVNSTLTYKITEVKVKVGDIVTEGQTLADLDLSELERNIADTQKSLANAKAKDDLQRQQAQCKLDEAIETRDINLARNEAAISTAAEALNTANNSLIVANDKLNAANDRVSTAQDAVNTCQTELGQAETNRDNWTAPEDDSTAVNPYIAIVETVQANLANAQNELANARQALPEVQQAQSTAASTASSAQSAYNTSVTTRDTTYRNDSISSENARDSLNSAKLNNSAQTYQTQLDNYLKQKEDAVITAPISGTVTAVSAQVGDVAGSSAGAGNSNALFTIEDTKKLEVPAYIPEYDTIQLRMGMQVEVTTDAISDEVWKGSIASISPTAADSNGNFLVTISITSPVNGLAGGMSAKMNIVVDSKSDVYAVPYDAVVVDESGAQVVYVLEEESTAPASGDALAPRKAINVTTGMETDYYIEIISDELVDGMQVVNDPAGKNMNTETTGNRMFG